MIPINIVCWVSLAWFFILSSDMLFPNTLKLMKNQQNFMCLYFILILEIISNNAKKVKLTETIVGGKNSPRTLSRHCCTEFRVPLACH